MLLVELIKTPFYPTKPPLLKATGDVGILATLFLKWDASSPNPPTQITWKIVNQLY